ncbi:glycoside hydrolase family 16 protein [Neorhodopirellula pilleata]|uniref:Endo-1,3-1,4-beta-glycanase ExsH n=1 Tax=Neorhodopirellula pilleata TaxID=2714738 RepID=A0A5C6APZ8_9BACT|nr:glycoside hydrolase family 16 protein [Neorhodopirellula pilleata]TWU01608.1 Endo-1,3-1,4-beta-glycanase ExsH [Neorhodopirellula pilleata]
MSFRFTALLLTLLAIPSSAFSVENETTQIENGFHEFNDGHDDEGAEKWTQVIRVTQPEPRSEVSGMVTVTFSAKSMTEAAAFCWTQPDGSAASDRWGRDVNVAPEGIVLDARGNGSFRFDADAFPNGPMNVRIYAKNKAGIKDIYELQLFNKGGAVWNQGIPDNPPPAAEGMKLVFEDDFDGPLSISNDGRGATYSAHKPGGGDFSGWPFSDVLGDGKPFSRKGTWLRISARKDQDSPNGISGLIASVDADFRGTWTQAPCYLECRFTAQSAIGTWPAFWTLALGENGTDELDIVEAYGGKGKGNPNHPGYSIVTHFWGQKNQNGQPKEAFSARPEITKLGGKSYWSTTFHTYGVYVGSEQTVYYFDDIEVFRHPSGDVSKKNPHFFLINLAIGGISGWPIDLERYGNGTDMWIDYVRVYSQNPVDPDYLPDQGPKPQLATAGIGLNFQVKDQATTRLRPKDTAGHESVSQRNWNNLIGPDGALATLNDDQGETIPEMSVLWSVPEGDQAWRSRSAREWGFQHGNLALQSGFIQLGGSLEVTGIPFENYDVFVYVGAGDQGGSGSVTLRSDEADKVDPAGTYYYDLSWHDGKFKISESTDPLHLAPGNTVAFRGNSANSVQIQWNGNLKGGWTGVTGIQIVASPEPISSNEDVYQKPNE